MRNSKQLNNENRESALQRNCPEILRLKDQEIGLLILSRLPSIGVHPMKMAAEFGLKPSDVTKLRRRLSEAGWIHLFRRAPKMPLQTFVAYRPCEREEAETLMGKSSRIEESDRIDDVIIDHEIITKIKMIKPSTFLSNLGRFYRIESLDETRLPMSLLNTILPCSTTAVRSLVNGFVNAGILRKKSHGVYVLASRWSFGRTSGKTGRTAKCTAYRLQACQEDVGDWLADSSPFPAFEQEGGGELIGRPSFD